MGDPSAPLSTTQMEMALIHPVTDSGRNLLRTRRVLCVGFNDVTNEVVVFTRRAAPSTKKQLAALPAEIDGVSIKYRQGVQSQIGVLPSIPQGGPTFSIRQGVSGGTHYACGSSISVGNNREAGTMGCLVRDSSGALYGLSNNHVSGSCSFAGVGLPIVAPGIFDVVPQSLSPFTIGFHHAALPLVAGSADNVDPKANLDAAIFKIAKEEAVSSYQGMAYDTPTNVGAIVPGAQVEKVGRTTGHTKGVVISQIHGAHGITYGAHLYGFSGVVYFDPVFAIAGTGTAFSDHGDSGSLITTIDAQGARVAVGLVVGGMADSGAPGGQISIALPIQPILSALKVTLVSGHNV